MLVWNRSGRAWLALGLALAAAPAHPQEENPAPSERHAPCMRRDPERQPFFGDLHVHTGLSFDAYSAGRRADPNAAYRFARGESLDLPGPDATSIALKLRRPLDFAAVTDHAELLGEVELCTRAALTPAYWSPTCIATRSNRFPFQLFATRRWAAQLEQPAEQRGRAFICRLPGSLCAKRALGPWLEIQRAAEAHYDRSARCRFTTFVAYEYSETTPDARSLHRSVIFRNERVPTLPVSAYDTGTEGVPGLWRRLRAQCLETGRGCDVLAIPHGSSLAGGLELTGPADPSEARDRAELEPLVEIVQQEGASECRSDRPAGRGAGTIDELCGFEQIRGDQPAATPGTRDGETRSARSNLLRGALLGGLALEQRSGLDPIRFGFVGSTGTHGAAAGAVAEDVFPGPLSRRGTSWRALQDPLSENPGGLAAVWAEENTRDAIFAALRRRETYATSGTRLVVRFFGGWEFGAQLCQRGDLVRQGYSIGVPMGMDLPPDVGGRAPRFVISAQMDPGSPDRPGTPLQRIQIIKGWVDSAGETHERVHDVAGDTSSGRALERATCTPDRAGSAGLCAVWQDPEFDPRAPAFYYARVLENPTCRWSTHHCLDAGVSPFAPDCPAQAEAAGRAARALDARSGAYAACCGSQPGEPSRSPVIQERAWTSPIWYRAN